MHTDWERARVYIPELTDFIPGIVAYRIVIPIDIYIIYTNIHRLSTTSALSLPCPNASELNSNTSWCG